MKRPGRKGPPACNPVMCRTCIFREDGHAVDLRPGRLAEIQSYLIQGTTHHCHTSEAMACRGGRDWQLVVWHRIGILPAPTDEALAAEMEARGL